MPPQLHPTPTQIAIQTPAQMTTTMPTQPAPGSGLFLLSEPPGSV